MRIGSAALFAALALPAVLRAQDAGFEAAAKPVPKSYIVYAAEAQTIAAGKSAVI